MVCMDNPFGLSSKSHIPLMPHTNSPFLHNALRIDLTRYQIPFDDELTKECDLVFAHAPERAKAIIDHLRNPLFINRRNYRSAFFVGDPGIGKTTKNSFKFRWFD